MRDTICAISTPPGRGGIAVIRISGSKALYIARKLFKDQSPLSPRRAYLRDLFDSTGRLIDRGIILYFKSPNSYTGEDVIEIHTHGGYIVPGKILNELIAQGSRLAVKGEFTKRAFLNGKIDLLQAEAVNEIISAKTELQYQKSLEKITGKLREKFAPIFEQINNILLDLEAYIEFEEDTGQLDRNKFRTSLEDVIEKAGNMLERAEQGLFIKNGINIAIIGRVNVGKSSLFNAILGYERAIVTPYEGTTRDIIQEEISIEGIPVRLHDTAGHRETSDFVEKIGIEFSKKALSSANIVLFVSDASRGISNAEKNFYNGINVPSLFVLNKTDLAGQDLLNHLEAEIIPVSALTGKGIDLLISKIAELIKTYYSSEDSYMLNNRETALLQTVISDLLESLKLFNNNKEPELVSFHINEALKSLNEIFGYGNLPEEILNAIFNKFCIGK